jgi:phosphomevalonate kinase
MEKNYISLTTKSPGKILVCGGYVILSDKYKGLVLTTDVFFKCNSRLTNIEENHETIFRFTIFSSLFNQTFILVLKILKELENYKLCIEVKEVNNFINFSIISALYFFILENMFTVEKLLYKKYEIQIELESDYRFYSYDPLNIKNSKTGLGSSSALIVSLSSNIYLLLMKYFYNDINIENLIKDQDINLYSNLLLSAFYSNNLAQNKVLSNK